MKLVLSVVLTVAVILQLTNGEPVPPQGRSLVNLGGRLYFFDTTAPSTWTEAKNFCRSINMFLLSVENAEENQLIVDYITTTAGLTNYWMSGNDIGRERGDYIWDSTGDRVFYSDFHPGEPNFDPNEHFLHYQYLDGVLKWNDVAENPETTSNPSYTICEQSDIL